MKKLSIMFLIAVSSAMLLVGCGDKNEGASEVISGSDIGLTPAEEQTEVVEETTEAAEEDVPPEEGMVRSKLTNEWITEEQANARPIAVMMPTDKEAQPQYGIGKADILYECMEEGSISRQLAVIDDWQDLEKIGNVRSCRLYYIAMASEWDPILVHFGGVFYMRDRIKQGDVNNISGTYSDGTKETSAPGAGAFFRDNNKKAPHNAYVSGSSLKKAMDSLGYEENHREDFYQADHFKFAAPGTENNLDGDVKALDAKEVDLSDIFPVTKSKLVYNEEDKLYYKYLHGKEQIDAETGEQLTFDNIIVQNTYYEYAPDNKYLVFQMHDTKRDGYFITRGKAIHVTWEKTSDYAPTRYFDDNGNEIELNKGKTYIAVAQHDTELLLK